MTQPVQQMKKKKRPHKKQAGPGAPIANKNRTASGLRVPFHVRMSRLPRNCSYITKQINDLREHLRVSVAALRGLPLNGELSDADELEINEACLWDVHRLLAARWLQIAPDLSAADKLNHSREVPRAASERNKVLKRIGLLDRSERDEWATILATPIVTSTPQQPTNGAPTTDTTEEATADASAPGGATAAVEDTTP